MQENADIISLILAVEQPRGSLANHNI